MPVTNRHFTEEIKFRLTKEQKQRLLAAAKASEKPVSDFLRQALNQYLSVEEMENRKNSIQAYVAAAVEEKLRPVENRLAKISAKTAHAASISIFMQAQAMSDLGKSDVVQIFRRAREKGLAFVRERDAPTTYDLENFAKNAEKGE